MTGLSSRVLASIAEVDASAWDALAGDDDPFAEHAFLHALEASGSASDANGWSPRHVAVFDGARLVAAMPLYAKTHSYGEFIFDFAWADASHRMRARYYPKLVSMIPFTPATGRRFLVADDRDRGPLVRALLDETLRVAETERASSVHLLFLDAREASEAVADGRFLRRATHQYHFENHGYASFDDLLSRFRSEARKQVRRERRIASSAGLEIRTKPGEELTSSEWTALATFYFDTCARKGSPAYLDVSFFDLVRRTFAHRVVASFAYDRGEPVAGSLAFEKGRVLYGRYWGATEAYEMLHFELCYYRLIERTIEKGHLRFEAGAQGEHKIKRGLLPAIVHSAHHLRNPVLREAVAEYLVTERARTTHLVEDLGKHGPFRRAHEDEPREG